MFRVDEVISNVIVILWRLIFRGNYNDSASLFLSFDFFGFEICVHVTCFDSTGFRVRFSNLDSKWIYFVYKFRGKRSQKNMNHFQTSPSENNFFNQTVENQRKNCNDYHKQYLEREETTFVWGLRNLTLEIWETAKSNKDCQVQWIFICSSSLQVDPFTVHSSYLAIVATRQNKNFVQYESQLSVLTELPWIKGKLIKQTYLRERNKNLFTNYEWMCPRLWCPENTSSMNIPNFCFVELLP